MFNGSFSAEDGTNVYFSISGIDWNGLEFLVMTQITFRKEYYTKVKVTPRQNKCT